MNRIRSLLPLLSTAMLGLIAAVAVASGLFLLLGAWLFWHDAAIDNGAAIGAVIFAALTFAFAALAIDAARDEWLHRARGRMLGLIVGIVGLLSAVLVLSLGDSAGWDGVFCALAGLSILTILPLLVPDRTSSRAPMIPA